MLESRFYDNIRNDTTATPACAWEFGNMWLVSDRVK